MSEVSTTPDLVELTAQAFEAASRHDADAVMSSTQEVFEHLNRRDWALKRSSLQRRAVSGRDCSIPRAGLWGA